MLLLGSWKTLLGFGGIRAVTYFQLFSATAGVRNLGLSKKVKNGISSDTMTTLLLWWKNPLGCSTIEVREDRRNMLHGCAVLSKSLP